MISKIVFVFVTVLVENILGHGMMLDPPNRSSAWRYDSSAVINYQDNQNFCGGYYTQYYVNDGKCGVCGDNFADPHPQKNENTGLYGQGKITRKYTSGSVIDVSIRLTANHLGTFTYSLCELADPESPESGEDCFTPLLLEDGSSEFKVSKTDFDVKNRVKLPGNVKCNRCVLRWNYRAGNNWGVCDDGSQGMGCGTQENFRSCADIAIV